ncbi:MAG: hypothetical protein Q8M10_00775 [Methylotenera sp.]|uniref:hypothetical protein n=1 Tax=Methylotenera sp. TaxID=2051956 RepID=UPI002731D7DA|nr:hypothetical protein [Methylotenera sp.]MDP1521665.1 hypothetical protein [Methylotenera sp.]
MSSDQWNNTNYWRNQAGTEADNLQREKEKARREKEELAEQQQRDQARQSSNVNYLQAKLSDAEKEIEYYKNLLTKPMLEIAKVNQDFEKTYQEQQIILGEWMVSQRAFKELAIKLGIEAGMTKDDVMKSHSENKEKVLNNQTEHGNNFVNSNEDEWAMFYAPKIKLKQGIK